MIKYKPSVECWYDFGSWALPLNVNYSRTRIHKSNYISNIYGFEIMFLCFGIRLEIWDD